MNHTEHKKRISPLFLILIVIIGPTIVHTVSFSVLYTYAKVIGGKPNVLSNLLSNATVIDY
jgi:hypothetical protein